MVTPVEVEYLFPWKSKIVPIVPDVILCAVDDKVPSERMERPDVLFTVFPVAVVV